ncbi:MAG: glycosyltransferase family 2 protein [Candidatus Portnoybacteria bacterium]|nr:glycosyltransferase family 2 protein [Candidatus Portnoybacteria bacterium]MDD4983070.1 glycosyltransferase family 2 protein [Candidatus Portnoybacteria bacterium]
MPKLSIIVPVFNEVQTIQEVLERLLALAMDKEIIVVDDGSTDGTSEKISGFYSKIKNLKHESNLGKGAAVKTGIDAARGNFVVFCDADLEYDIDQISSLFDHLLKNDLSVVYGSRFVGYRPEKNKVHYLGNRFLTGLTNFLFGAKLTDMETAYKMFRADILKNLSLAGKRFEIEPEITAKILKQGIKITELSITYNPRVKKEGKKVKYRDGLTAIKVLIREKLKNQEEAGG